MTSRRFPLKADAAKLAEVVHYYRQFRSDTCGALAAWMSARRHIHFRATLKADIAASAKRSKAAKKAAKTRRARAA